MKIGFLLFVFLFYYVTFFCQEINNNSELNIVKKDSVIAITTNNQLSKLGYSMSIFSGYSMLTDDLKSNFKNFIPIGMSFSVEYNRIMELGFEFSYSASKTKKDIPVYYGFWNEGYRANFTNLELYFGPSINYKFLSLKPILGVTITEIRSKDRNYLYLPPLIDEPPYPYDQARFDSTSYLFGLILNIETSKEKTLKGERLLRARLKYTYYVPHFDKKYEMFNGNIHSITIGFDVFLSHQRKIKS